MFNLTGRTALVTGASGGIGSAIAKALSDAGAKVVLSGTREGVLNELAATLKGESAVVTCNLSDPEAVDGLAARAEEVVGPLDILVANAGITRDKLLMQMKDDDWNDVINVNLGSYYRLTKSVVRGMMKRRHGRIIGITSVVGVTGNPGPTNYCASKAGAVALMKQLAVEYGPGLRVNAICPGPVDTPLLWDSAVAFPTPETAVADAEKATLLKRLGRPEDVAQLALFLASDDAAWITGTTVTVDGGIMNG